MKNPQTTIALTFLTYIISDIDGVQKVQTLSAMSLPFILKISAVMLFSARIMTLEF